MSTSSDGPLMVSVSGVRGIVGKTMTPEVAVRFAGAVGTWLVRRAKAAGAANNPGVVLGWDGRAGGEIFYHAAASGLMASGCSVTRLGVAMTPTIGVAVDDPAAQAVAGMQITASHNPQMWNGMKVLLRDATEGARGEIAGQASAPNATLAGEIIECFRRGDVQWQPVDGMGWEEDLHRQLLTQSHAMLVHKQVSQVRGTGGGSTFDRWPRIVLDCCNASGAELTPAFLRDLGCEPRVFDGDEARGTFPHEPEPTEANLTGLAAEVRKYKADIGFAQDPDADRLAIIDENGKYIGEEYTLVLAALALAEFDVVKKGSVLAVNLSTSRMIEDVAATFGASVVRTPVGEANVVEAMKKLGPEKCPLGGEGNGGVIWPRVTYVRDSLSGMALVLALMAKTGKTVSQLVAGVPAYSIVKRKVDLADRVHAQAAGEKVAGHFKGAKVDTQDGVRLDFDDATYGKAWLHVRASNTEPIMRLIAEAPTKGQAEKLLDEAARAIG